MIETTRVEQWIYETLTADPTLTGLIAGRIYGNEAPQDAGEPFVVFSLQTATDVRGVGPARIMIDGLWLVKAVAATPTFTTLRPIGDRVDAVLHAADGDAGGVAVMSCLREQTVAYAEVSDGIVWRHLGALYRLQAQETP